MFQRPSAPWLVGTHECPECSGQRRQVEGVGPDHSGRQAGQGGVAYTVGDLEDRGVKSSKVKFSQVQNFKFRNCFVIGIIDFIKLPDYSSSLAF